MRVFLWFAADFSFKQQQLETRWKNSEVILNLDLTLGACPIGRVNHNQQSTMIIFLLFFLPSCESWCNPQDSGECALIIRGGRNSNDGDDRSIKFLNHAHDAAGSISVHPLTNTMRFSTGVHSAPHMTIHNNGTVAAHDLHINTLRVHHVNSTDVHVEQIRAKNIATDSIQTTSLVSNTSMFATTNITKDLHVVGRLSVATAAHFVHNLRVSSGNVHVENEDGRSGILLEQTGGLKIYRDSNTSNGHIDFKSSLQEDSSVRISASVDTLLLHGRHVIITHNGRVGIGTEPTHPLHVNGVVRAASSTITTGSDRRVKQDIQAVNKTESLLKISKLQVRNFQWHPSYKHTTKQLTDRKVGFIAQELKMVIPEAVQREKGIETFTDKTGKVLLVPGMHTVSLDPVIMTLISAVQKLKEQVDRLTEQVNCCEEKSACGGT